MNQVSRSTQSVRFALRLFVLCIFAAASYSHAAAQQKMLTIDDIFDPAKRVNFSGTMPQLLGWTPDGKYYLQAKLDRATRLAQLLRVDAVTGQATPFFDNAKMEAALAKIPGVTPDDAKRLANRPSYEMNAAQTATLLPFKNDIFYYEFASGAARRLTNDDREEENAEFSPDGRMIAFTRDSNLFAVDVATGRETKLTTDGSEKILNGRLDWVYEEELYGRGNTKGFWWSPDSKRIAYLRIDENPVKTFVVTDHIPTGQVIEDTPYPLAGDPNPLVRLGVVSFSFDPPSTKWNEPRTQFIDTAKYQPADFLISRVAWRPNSQDVIYQAQNREQTFLDMNAGNVADGKTTTLFRETTKAWVEAADNPEWLKDGSFLWRSERTGFAHIYHFAADGKLIKQLTDGKWEARSISAVDEANGFIYFSSTANSHIAEQLYRVKMDGTGLQRITQTEGSHRAQINPNATHFVDFWSDVNTPTQVRLYDRDGKLVRVIEENKVAALTEYRLSTPQFLKVKTRDGFEMEAMMIKPPDFDASKKYPVFSYTYSGPHAPSVANRWGGSTYIWYQMLAQKGYIIWVCDNRSASGKGAESAWTSYKSFGPQELKDLEDGVAYLRSQPFVDAARIGISGWSFGGFMTSYALTHSDAFKIGIAGGSVTDWKNYDSIYTERYMSTPQRNAQGYEITSVNAAAKNLRGRLLLVHGAMDDNVHMSNTIQLVYELQKAGKPFDLMVYPKSRHGVSDPALVKHMRQMMTDFIVNNL